LAFVSSQDWRIVLLSLIPGSFLLGSFIESFREFSLGHINRSRRLRIFTPLLLIALVLSGSFIGLLPRVFDPSTRIRQEAVVDSMLWLRRNDNGRSVASVGLLTDYRYLTTLTGIIYVGDFNEDANSAIAQSKATGFRYVAVASQSPQFPTFESSSIVHEKYRNNIVTIFYIPL
jgi:hypothetical protein